MNKGCDIAYGILSVTQHVTDAIREEPKAATWILRSLTGKLSLGINFRRGQFNPLQAFTHAPSVRARQPQGMLLVLRYKQEKSISRQLSVWTDVGTMPEERVHFPKNEGQGLKHLQHCLK